MDVLLIKAGQVDNVISADSIERAQQFYPQHLCVERTGPEGPGWAWDGAAFTPPAAAAEPVAVRHITRLAFLDRFTDAEAIAIDLAGQGATLQAAAMRRYLSKVNNAVYIDLDRADTRAGVQQLEAAGMLGAGRALQILDTPVQPHEIYKGGA